MSVVSIETAAISKSRLKKGFNGDSINLNRRISSIDEMNTGYRAAGTVNPPCVCAVVSSVIKGVSAGAVTAFDDYSHRIYTQRTNAYEAFKKYADDMTSVSTECGDGNVSIACVCIFSDRILVSSVGNAKIFFCSAGKAQLLSHDGEFMFTDLTELGADGGYIAVFGAECSEFADEKLVEKAAFGGKDIKSVGKSAFIALSKRSPDADITGVFFKFTADDSDDADEFIPAVSSVGENESGENDVTPDAGNSGVKPVKEEPEINEENESAVFVSDSYDADEEYDGGENKKKKPGNKLKTLIPFIILLLLVAGVSAYFTVTKDKDDKPTVSDVPSEAVNASIEDDSVTKRDSSATEKETTTAPETTTKKETTTKRTSETTTRRTQSERTTEKPRSTTTEKPTEAAAETTTEKPTDAPAETTTERPTDSPAETTTEKPTDAPAETTAAPTTEAPTVPTTRITDQGNNEKPDV